jgi:hypothetical protein
MSKALTRMILDLYSTVGTHHSHNISTSSWRVDMMGGGIPSKHICWVKTNSRSSVDTMYDLCTADGPRVYSSDLGTHFFSDNLPFNGLYKVHQPVDPNMRKRLLVTILVSSLIIRVGSFAFEQEVDSTMNPLSELHNMTTMDLQMFIPSHDLLHLPNSIGCSNEMGYQELFLFVY